MLCILNNNIKKAVDVSQRAQRNYDLSKTIPENDLHTLIYAAKNSPAKQNETHYALEVYTDPELIHRVYNETKKFTLGSLEQEACTISRSRLRPTRNRPKIACRNLK